MVTQKKILNQFLWVSLPFILLCFCSFLQSNIAFNPYAKVFFDYFYDTRQLYSARENFEVFSPLPVLYDRYGHDINAHANWNMTSIQTILGITAECPWPWDKEDSVIRAVIEGDFLGATRFLQDSDVVGNYRMRFGYINLVTPCWELLAGEYWHPLLLLDCCPLTISFNWGAPLEPQARNPQVRFTSKPNDSISLLLAASAQNTFLSLGPDCFSFRYSADSVTPNFTALFRYTNSDFFCGAAFDYKRLMPRLKTDKCFDTNAAINSVIAEVFASYTTENGHINAKIVYSQNGTDQFLFSGYAVATRDPITDKRTYRPTQEVSAWIDAAYWLDGTKELGIFAGIGKNLGSTGPLYTDPRTHQPIVYSLFPQLDLLFRISPRLRFVKKPMTIGIELEYTQSAFGYLDRFARPRHTQTVRNVRPIFEILYSF